MRMLNDSDHDEQFFWFVRRINKYRNRYDFMPDGEIIKNMTRIEGWSRIIPVYKVYDKYSPTIIARNLDWEDTCRIINVLNNEDIAYQRAIYEYSK